MTNRTIDNKKVKNKSFKNNSRRHNIRTVPAKNASTFKSTDEKNTHGSNGVAIVVFHSTAK